LKKAFFQQPANVILAAEETTSSYGLYAFITNFGNLTSERVLTLTVIGGQRHRIED